jgi:hypothetical protein
LKNLHVNAYVIVGTTTAERSHTVTTEHVRSVRELARLFQQATRRASEFVVLLWQNGLGRVDQRVHLAGGLFVVLGRRRAPNGFGKYLVKRQFDVGVVHHVVVFHYDDFGYDVLIFDQFDVVDIHDVITFDVLDVFYIYILDIVEVHLTNRLLVEPVGELFFIEYFF